MSELLLPIKDEMMSAPHPANRLVFCSPSGNMPLLFRLIIHNRFGNEHIEWENRRE
jgi:hypothetical protein